MPPVPPAVAAQQGAPPLQQFAQSASQGGEQMPSSDQLMAKYIDQVGQGLTKIAQIAQQSKPELIPVLKQAVQAMAMFASKIKSGAQQGAPDGGNQGTAGGGAPDAAGGSAMGMPQ